MSLEFKIDTEAGFVYTVGHGAVSFDEFVEHRKQITLHPNFNKEFSHLLDYREVVMDRNTNQARNIAGSIPFARVAMVAGEKAFGFTRMVQGWEGEEVLKVFREMASAREWLGLPPQGE